MHKWCCSRWGATCDCTWFECLMLIQLISSPRNCPSLSLSWFKRLPVAAQTAYFTWVRLVFKCQTLQLSFAVVKRSPSKLNCFIWTLTKCLPASLCLWSQTVLFWICDREQRRGKSLSAKLVFVSSCQNVSVSYLASVKTSVTCSRTQKPKSASLCVWVLV